MSSVAPGALAGLRVVEFAAPIHAYAGKLLADFGAEVVLVEPPEGDVLRRRGPFRSGRPHPEGSYSFAYYHVNKQSVTLADGDDEHRRALIAAADVVLTDGRWLSEIGPSVNPWQVACSVTPYGLSGPYADLPATHLTSAAMGGAYVVGEGVPHPMPDQQMYDDAAAHAAVAILVALRNRSAVGGQLVEIAAHEVMATKNHLILRFGLSGFDELQTAGQGPPPPAGTWQCLDGVVEFQSRPRQWPAFVSLLGEPAELRDPAYTSPPARVADRARITAVIAPILEQRPTVEVFARAQELGIPCAPVNTLLGFARDPQTVDRGTFARTVAHPYLGDVPVQQLARMTEPLVVPPAAAPLLGRGPGRFVGGGLSAPPAVAGLAAAEGLPMERVRVLSFGGAIAGNACAMTLAELGADVVKIEAPQRPDNNRALLFPDHPPTLEPSGMSTTALFGGFARSVKDLVLDLGGEAGKAIFRDLVAVSDVVVENFRPGVLDRWGLDFDTLLRVNPGIVVLSMSGFGATAPRRDHVSYGAVSSAFSGLTHRAGVSNLVHHDYLACVQGAFAVLAALDWRDRTGRGTWIDLAQSEAGAAVMGPVFLQALLDGEPADPEPQLAPGSLWHAVLPCGGDGSFLAIETPDRADWGRLRALVDGDGFVLPEDPSGPERGKADAVLTDWLADHRPVRALRRLAVAGVAAGVVQRPGDLYGDPQLRARAGIVPVRHPDLGEIEYPAPPFRLDRTPARVKWAVPRFGEHTDEILTGLLGRSTSELEQLRAAAVIGPPRAPTNPME